MVRFWWWAGGAECPEQAFVLTETDVYFDWNKRLFQSG